MILKYTKKKEDNYETVRQVLKQEFFISSNLLTDLRKNKLIFVNGNSTYLDFKLQESDVVTVDFDLIETPKGLQAINVCTVNSDKIISHN